MTHSIATQPKSDLTTTTERAAGKPKRRRFALWVIPIPILVVVGVLLWNGVFAQAATSTDEYTTYEVKRGRLDITILERGTLDSAKSSKVESTVEGRNQLLKLHVQDGQEVETGQLMAELDVSEFDERVRSQKTVVFNAKSSLIQATSTVETQRITNQDDIARAELEVMLAENMLEKYIKGDFPQSEKRIVANKRIAEEEEKRAQDRLTWSEKLAARDFVTQNDLEADKIAVLRAELDVELAVNDLEVLRKYDYLQQKKTLEGDLASTRRLLKKVELTAAAGLESAKAKLESSQETHDVEAEKLEKYMKMTGGAKLRAPTDGLVIFGSVERGRGWGSRDEAIEEGVEIREGQTVFIIPDTSVMEAHTHIQEAMHNRVFRQAQTDDPNLKLKARILVDALGGQEYQGTVEFVSPTHDKSVSWFNPDLKIYAARVRMQGDTKGLRPGMSCSVEVIVESVPNALTVPLQAVRRDGGKNVVLMEKDGKLGKVAVQVGRDNGLFVEILGGIEEGDEIQVSQAAIAVGESIKSGSQGQESPPQAGADGERSSGPGGSRGDRAGPGADGGSRGERSGRGERGGRNREGGSREGGGRESGGRRGERGQNGGGGGGFDIGALEKRLKAAATPEDWKAYEAAKESGDRAASGAIFRKYMDKLRGDG